MITLQFRNTILVSCIVTFMEKLKLAATRVSTYYYRTVL